MPGPLRVGLLAKCAGRALCEKIFPPMSIIADAYRIDSQWCGGVAPTCLPELDVLVRAYLLVS